MKKILTTVIASAFALVTFNTVLIAGETSISAGAVLNYTTFEADGSSLDTRQSNGEVSKSISNDETYPSLFIEYNTVADSGFGLTMGFEILPGTQTFHSESRTDENPTDDDDGDAGVYTATAEISNPKTLYVEPTFMFNDGLGMFLKSGISHVVFKDGKKGARNTDFGQKDVFGGMIGVGTKYIHGSGAFLKLEGTYTKWSGFTVSPVNSNIDNAGESININPEQTSIRLAVGMAF